MAKRIPTVVVSIFFIVYPLFIYLGLTRFSPTVLGGVVLGVVGIRIALMKKISLAKLKALLPLSVAAAVLALFSTLFNNERALLLMPMAVNATLLATFGWTLFRGPTMIARFAALTEPVITDKITRYCRKVTISWCLFFVINGAIAAYTAFFTSKEYWALYNGLISYILMGLLFGTEFLVRKTVKKEENR